MLEERHYEPEFVRELFNGMASTYGVTNLVSSFGFCQRWRERCVELAQVQPGMVVYDLMSGMGECWSSLDRRLQGNGSVVALDFCPEMCARARVTRDRIRRLDVTLLQEDVLANSIGTASADRVLCSFGLKTFTEQQGQLLAFELARILKPGGRYSLLEISVPSARLLRWPYMLYLKYVIPVLGLLFLGNPRCYSMLGAYTEAFQNCRRMAESLRRAGLEVEYRELFFGCATALVGRHAAEQADTVDRLRRKLSGT